MSKKKDKTTSLAVVKKDLSTTVKKFNKQDLEQYLDLSMENYDLELTEAAANRYKRYVTSLKHGLHAAAPINCVGGRRCPIGQNCPFTERDDSGKPDYDASTYPLTRSCPIEKDMLKMHIMDLVEEYDVHPEDATDMSIISRLAVLNIYEYRAQSYLAKTDEEGGGLIIDEVTSANPKTGEPYLSKKIHPAFDVQEKIHKQKQELLRSMVATRREKYKAAAASGTQATKTNLTKSLQDIVGKINAAQELEDAEEVFDVEVEILEQREGASDGC